MAPKNMFPKEPGAISSTWGGGHVLDLAIGIKTIEIIKKEKMLESNRKMGGYILNRLKDIKNLSNPRGLGLMLAFDIIDHASRDNVVAECAKRGLLVLGCGTRGIRLIPPYVVVKEDVDKALEILEAAIKTCTKRGFNHSGSICDFIHCGKTLS